MASIPRRRPNRFSVKVFLWTRRERRQTGPVEAAGKGERLVAVPFGEGDAGSFHGFEFHRNTLSSTAIGPGFKHREMQMRPARKSSVAGTREHFPGFDLLA